MILEVVGEVLMPKCLSLVMKAFWAATDFCLPITTDVPIIKCISSLQTGLRLPRETFGKRKPDTKLPKGEKGLCRRADAFAESKDGRKEE